MVGTLNLLRDIQRTSDPLPPRPQERVEGDRQQEGSEGEREREGEREGEREREREREREEEKRGGDLCCLHTQTGMHTSIREGGRKSRGLEG